MEENKQNKKDERDGWIMILAVVILIIILFLLKTCNCCPTNRTNPQNDNENSKEVATNIIAIDDIEYNETIKETSLAFVSGQAITTVNSDNPNVFLQNDKENEDYYLEYEVYLDDELFYQSKLIPSGSAELWNAYEDTEVSKGTNNMHYKVNIYNMEKQLMAASNIDGLTLIKE